MPKLDSRISAIEQKLLQKNIVNSLLRTMSIKWIGTNIFARIDLKGYVLAKENSEDGGKTQKS
jgi:hypothetical protein